MNSSPRLLMRHQVKAKKFIVHHNYRAILAMDPGTMKTLTAIRAVHPPVLVICRRDDFFTWSTELEFEGISADRLFHIDHGSVELPQLEPNKWYFVTYDLCRNPRIASWINSCAFSFVIADECQLMKGFDAKRTTAIYKHTRHIPHRLGLTGTMIGNDPIDCFSQVKFIDDGRLLGTNAYEFRARNYLQAPNSPAWYLRRGAKDEIRRKLARICHTVKIDDVLDLPPIRRVYKAVPMTPAQNKLYNKVLEEWEYELEDGRVVEIDYVIVQVAKLRQIASGFLYDENKVAHWVKSAKLELYLDMLQDKAFFFNKPKLVTWCAHTAEIERIADEIPQDERVVFYGQMSRKSREAARTAFSTSPTIRHFIAQEDCGVGMNELICADTAVYFSNSRRVMSRVQSEGRTRRKGSEIHRLITYWDLFCEKSIDIHIAKDLTSKMDIASYIMRGLRKGVSLRKLTT